MPQPDCIYCSDYYLYKYIYNPIAKNICFIHPNIVTIIGGLYNNLMNSGNTIPFILLGLSKYILDCLDGSIARTCNLRSDIGALLDIGMDTIALNTILSVVMYKLYLNKNIHTYNIYLIIIFGFIMVYFLNQVIEEIKGLRNNETMFKTKFDKFFHDNLLVIIPIFYYVLKLIVNKYGNN